MGDPGIRPNEEGDLEAQDAHYQRFLDKTYKNMNKNSKMKIAEAATTLQYPKEVIRRLVDLIPFITGEDGIETGMELNEALKSIPELKTIYETEKDSMDIINLALTL